MDQAWLFFALLTTLLSAGVVRAALSQTSCSSATTKTACNAIYLTGDSTSSDWRTIGQVVVNGTAAEWPTDSLLRKQAGNALYKTAIVPAAGTIVTISFQWLAINASSGVLPFLLNGDTWNMRAQGQGLIEAREYYSYLYNPSARLGALFYPAKMLSYEGQSKVFAAVQSQTMSSVSYGVWMNSSVQFYFASGYLVNMTAKTSVSSTLNYTMVHSYSLGSFPSKMFLALGGGAAVKVRNIVVSGNHTSKSVSVCSWCTDSSTCIDYDALCPANCTSKQYNQDTCLIESPGWWSDWKLLHAATFVNDTERHEALLVSPSYAWQVGAAVFKNNITRSMGNVKVSFDLYVAEIADGVCLALMDLSKWDGLSIGPRGGHIGFVDFPPSYLSAGWVLWTGNWTWFEGVPNNGVTARGGAANGFSQFGYVTEFTNASWISATVNFTFTANGTYVHVSTDGNEFTSFYNVTAPDNMALMFIGASGGYIGEFRLSNARVFAPGLSSREMCHYCTYGTQSTCQLGNCSAAVSSSSSEPLTSSSQPISSSFSSSSSSSLFSTEKITVITSSSEAAICTDGTGGCAIIKVTNTTDLDSLSGTLATMLSIDSSSISCYLIENTNYVVVLVTNVTAEDLASQLQKIIDDLTSGFYNSSAASIIDLTFGAQPYSSAVSGASSHLPLLLLVLLVLNRIVGLSF